MKKDVLQGQRWPGLICHAICFVFIYSMFSPPHLSIHKMFKHIEIHTTLPCPPTTHSTSTLLNVGCFFRDTGAPFSAQDGKIFLLFVSFICTCIETKSILCSYQRRPFFVKPFFLCTSSHTPSHSLGCGVNFHYTSLRYNDFNGLHLLSLLLLFSLSDMHFIGF